MGEEQYEAAAEQFRAAYALAPLPQIANNWALCRGQAGDHIGVLAILQSQLQRPEPVPYTRALASLAHQALGQRAEAMKCLVDAISDYDRGLSVLAGERRPPDPGWVEYTLLIKQAAGTLGEHRLVLDLHNRWPGRDLAAGAFYAGVAAFNRGRYEQAARFWERISDRGWVRLAKGYAKVAMAVDQGIVPPFSLEYDPAAGAQPPEQATSEAVRELSELGSVRMRFLALLFSGAEQEPAPLVHAMVMHSGEWGIDLARRLMQVNNLPMAVKMGAARALLELGVIAAGEPVPIMHEGRSTEVMVQPLAVIEADPELERLVEEAIRLRDSDRKGEAIALLNGLWESGRAYPPAMVTLANLWRETGELESARSLLEAVDKLAPDHPGVLFNLAGLWAQAHDLERAKSYLRRINPTGQPEEFQRLYRNLMAYLNRAEAPGE